MSDEQGKNFYIQQLIETNHYFSHYERILETYFGSEPFLSSPLLSNCLVQLLIELEKRWRDGILVKSKDEISRAVREYRDDVETNQDLVDLLADEKNRAMFRAMLDNFAQIAFKSRKHRSGGETHTKHY